MHKTIAQKLHPGRFPNMSDKMAAIVGYLLGVEYTDPAIVDLCVTSDGYCLAQQAGDVGCNEFVGAYTELEHNWRTLVSMGEVGLSVGERAYCMGLLRTKIRRG